MTLKPQSPRTVIDLGSNPCLIMKIMKKLEFKYKGLNIVYEPIQTQWTRFNQCTVYISSQKFNLKFPIFRKKSRNAFFH